MNSASEPTVESCLKELREMFPGKWIYVELHLNAVCGPRGAMDVETFPEIQVDDRNGEVVYHQSNHKPLSLSTAMAQVHTWHKEQSDKQSQEQSRRI